MTMTTEFLADPIGFAKLYALCPPDNIGNYMGKDAKSLDTGDYQAIGPASGAAVQEIRYARVMRSKKVGYIELYDDTRGGNEGKDVVRFSTSYVAGGEREPVYFLPWDTSGAIIKLHIPPKGSTAPDPDVFFTAAINGCSVFIQGDADNPTVYHAGGSTGRKDSNDGARFWRHALQKHIKSSATAKARGAVKGEVNKTEYIKTPGTVGDATTVAAQEYEKKLKQLLDRKGSFEVHMVLPWACIFGLRTGTQWAFYLQQNATIICNYVKPTGVETRKYARPMQLSRIYPGSSRIAAMNHIVPPRIV